MKNEEGFDKFWAAYPKKRSKGDAYKAWCASADRRPPTEQIIKALTVLKASPDWTKDAGQFIPYPSTWLRAWGWDDVPEVQIADVRRDGKLWWQTVRGIEAKAEELNIEPWNGRNEGAVESWQQWAERVKRAAGLNVVQMVKTA